MKIIIAGDGKVGLTLTQKLSAAGHDLTLIDSNQRVLDSECGALRCYGGTGKLCLHARVGECGCEKGGSAHCSHQFR